MNAESIRSAVVVVDLTGWRHYRSGLVTRLLIPKRVHLLLINALLVLVILLGVLHYGLANTIIALLLKLSNLHHTIMMFSSGNVPVAIEFMQTIGIGLVWTYATGEEKKYHED